MAITSKDAVRIKLEDAEIYQLIEQANKLALNIVDRKDLHERDHLERVINVILGEIAEHLVIKWLQSQNKTVRSAVDKTAGTPDLGHDIILKSKKTGAEIECSIKSSLSFKYDLEGIIKIMSPATKRSELKTVNIQVYFWLSLTNEPRITVPSTNNVAIIGWFTKDDFKKGDFTPYKTEDRENPTIKLSEARPMDELLNYID